MLDYGGFIDLLEYFMMALKEGGKWENVTWRRKTPRLSHRIAELTDQCTASLMFLHKNVQRDKNSLIKA